MPQVGNKCPGVKEYHTFESRHCLTKCDHQCMPASVLLHIENRVRNDKHIGRYVSATALLGCLRSLYGERTLDYYVEPRKSWYSLRGTLLHNILEKPGFAAQVQDLRRFVYRQFKSGAVDRDKLEAKWVEIEASLLDFSENLPTENIPNWQSETEYEFPLGVIDGQERFLRGTLDVLRPETGEMYDYKTIGDRGLFILKDGAKEEHVMQFNIYRLMVERGYPVGQNYSTYTPIEIKKIVAFYMTMMQVVRTGDIMSENTMWVTSPPQPHPNMLSDPELLAQRVDRVLKKGKRKATATPEDYEERVKSKFRVTYTVPDVPLLNLDDVEEFVRTNSKPLFAAFDHGTMPPMCKPEMRAWKCDDYCPDAVREWCDAYNASVGESRVLIPAEEDLPVEV